MHLLILPGLSKEMHHFSELFNNAMPLLWKRRFRVAGSKHENYCALHSKSAFKLSFLLKAFLDMRKLYSILWSDHLLEQSGEIPVAVRTLVRESLAQEQRHGSQLLQRMVMRRLVCALAGQRLQQS